jgi:hypothetical protein
MQFKQEALAFNPWNIPREHTLHAISPDNENMPTMQSIHTVDSVAAGTSPLFPGGHSIQEFSEDEPSAVKYFPGMQGWQSDAEVAPSVDDQ